jgi:hypothetical protein
MPGHARNEIRYEVDIDPRTATIFECRAPWEPEPGSEWTRMPMARLRFTMKKGEWSLYWRDRNLAFHRYDRFAPSPFVGDLLDEIEADPTAIFWG